MGFFTDGVGRLADDGIGGPLVALGQVGQLRHDHAEDPHDQVRQRRQHRILRNCQSQL